MLNVLSLFDGMSCGQIALQRANIPYKGYFASEIDKFAIKITQKNYPNTIQLGDVRDWYKWDLPEIDLILAGSPCQGFSFSGHGLAFKDERSKLYFEFLDILEYIKPKYWLLENTRMKKQFSDRITRNLGTEPVLINSALVSAQDRKRLYWANFPITQPEDKGILLKDIIEDGYVDRDKSYTIDANYYKGGSEKTLKHNYLDKSRRQAVQYQSARRLMVEEQEDCWRKLTPLECERLQTVPENYTEGVSNTQRYKMLGNGWTVDVIAHILKGIHV